MPVPVSFSRQRRAIIIGGSMSGTAAFLRQIGWACDVYERSTVELAGRGAGITTHPEHLEALQKSGAGTRDLGVAIEKRITLDRAGRVIGEKHLPQIHTSWDRLQRLPRESIDPAHYHLSWDFERVEQDVSGVSVHFSGGRVEHGDVLVGGDGVRSGVRAAIMPEVQPIYWRIKAGRSAVRPCSCVHSRWSAYPSRLALGCRFSSHSRADVVCVDATARDENLGRAEALRRAMTAMIEKNEPRQAHPSYWGPFVLVGEGAAVR
jgi:2-polyprenyl-6-methoxyphenol hydroxylase-like FAD-dependent oxidoreductase